MRAATLMGLAVVAAVTALSCSAPAEPPAPDLDGAYRADIGGEEFEAFNPVTFPPEVMEGRWLLEIDGTEYRLSSDGFGNITGRISIGDGELSFADVPAPVGAFNCETREGERAVTRAEGTGDYDFEIAGSELELTARYEPCSFRGLLMERRWSRE